MLSLASFGFTPPPTPAPQPTTISTRRHALSTAAGAFLAASGVAQQASAKAGEFGKISIFGVGDVSSPYNPGGPKAGKDATFGYAKSDGPILAEGYEADVSREKAAFLESSKRISSLQPKLDAKTWWFVRDELRVQAYNMRSSMLAINKVLPADKKEAATAAYKKYWAEVEAFDLACAKKEPALANKEYADVLAALKAYTALV